MYLFYGDACIAEMVADQTLMETAICFPKTQMLKNVIPKDVLDPSDALRTLNPYLALESYEEDERKAEHDRILRLQRMNELAPYLDNDIIYVENVYVAEDYRRHGYCRLLFDILRAQFGDVAIWVNMEPAPGEDAKEEDAGSTYPVISMSDVGQVSLNACIAQHLGFTVDPDDWHRDMVQESKSGKKTYQCVLIRKIAHSLPEYLRRITAEDRDLVSLGYAMQKEKFSGKKKRQEKAIYESRKEDAVTVATDRLENGKRIYLFAQAKRDGSERFYGVSDLNPVEWGMDFVTVDERYESPEETKETAYYPDFLMLQQYLDERLQIDSLENGEPDQTEKSTAKTASEKEGVEKTTAEGKTTKSGYRIAQIRADYYEGYTCGPMDTDDIAEAAIIDRDGNIFYITLSEFCGLVNGYFSEKSAMDCILESYEVPAGSPQQEKCVEYLGSRVVFETQYGEDPREFTKGEEFDRLYQLLYYIAINQPYDEEYEKRYNQDLDRYRGQDPMEVEVPADAFADFDDADDFDDDEDADGDEQAEETNTETRKEEQNPE